jgi:hypothetical protein
MRTKSIYRPSSNHQHSGERKTSCWFISLLLNLYLNSIINKYSFGHFLLLENVHQTIFILISFSLKKKNQSFQNGDKGRIIVVQQLTEESRRRCPSKPEQNLPDTRHRQNSKNIILYSIRFTWLKALKTMFGGRYEFCLTSLDSSRIQNLAR